MPDDGAPIALLDPDKFKDPDVTAKGEARASVALSRLHTLWINTGTLCNLECLDCYIESSPTNDRLAYMTAAEVTAYLDEIRDTELPVKEIAFTGGEPFMNPDFMEMLEICLVRGFDVLVLTNAMKPLHHKKETLLTLQDQYPGRMSFRVSIDHPEPGRHEELRGPNSWAPMLEGLSWLAANKFNVAVAGRTRWFEDEQDLRTAYGDLFAAHDIAIDANDPIALVLFPEMNEQADVPEITTACWDILKVSPDAMMCATSRMVVKRKGAAHPVVMPCTLLPYDTQFEMGTRLDDAAGAVKLNHPHCAKFCVLGGGACSVADCRRADILP